MKQWLTVGAIVGLILGAGLSLVTKPSTPTRRSDEKGAAHGTSTSRPPHDPFDRAYFFPDPEKSSDPAVIAVCAGTAAGVPGTPEPAALPPDRRQSVAIVVEQSAEPGGQYSADETNMKWVVTDYTGQAVPGWTPSSVRQIKLSREHLGYVVCVGQTGITFNGKCGDRDVVKVGVRVSVREAHSGAELEGFDAAPANPTGCGPDPQAQFLRPDWDSYGDRVTEIVRR